MGFTMSKFGDWTKAGLVLQGLQRNINPTFKVQLKEDGELVLKAIQDHIDNQDLDWTPLQERTIELKGGDSTIYVESGWLRDQLSVRKIKSSDNSVTFFVGASAWKTHEPSGMKFSDLMIWLEYGTDKLPPRPLIRPTWEEIEPILKQHWREILSEMIKKGGKA